LSELISGQVLQPTCGC